MKSSLISLALFVTTTLSLKVNFKQTRQSSLPTIDRRASTSFSKGNKPLSNKFKSLAATSGNDGKDSTLTLSDVRDLIYLANITIGGNDYTVQLDTGSSDLWVQGPAKSLPNVQHTDTTYNLTYGIGWAYGPVSYAEVEFAGLKIPQQALIDVSSAYNPALSYGAQGILGLGFTSLSTVDFLVNKTGNSTGRSVLFNAFATNPNEPNFIAFALSNGTRSGNEDEYEGSFAIGEYEDDFKSVAQTNEIPTWPVNAPSRWNVLLEALIVGQTIVPVTTNVTGAPSNRAVALLDSGTSFTYASEDFCNAIYGGVKGAYIDPKTKEWIVPCDAEIDIALQFDGRAFPIHPLDVSPASGGANTCIGSFIPQSVSVGAGQFDILVGDNVLRSMYTIFDFGDFDASQKMGNPFVKLLSLVKPDQASSEFAKTRGSIARTGISYPTTNSASGVAAAGSDSTTISVSSDVARVLDTLGTYFPALAGVIALNAVVLLVLLFLAIYYICAQRRKKTGARPRSTIGRATPRALTPMPMDDFNSQYAPPMPMHSYQPVSMAMSEDTVMVPPSPGFKYDPESAKGLQRPHSYAASASSSSPLNPAYPPGSQPIPLSLPANHIPEDEPFHPPAPNFARPGAGPSGDRPKSYA